MFEKEISILDNIASGRESSGKRRNIWKGIRSKPEYNQDAEQISVYQRS